MKLISMTDFVEKIRKESNVSPFNDEQKEMDNAELYKIFNYAHFLKQPLKLEMFVPCDEKGNVLEKPKDYQKYIKHNFYASKVCKTYQEAKEKVLFESFEIDLEEGCGFPFLNNHPPFFFSIDNKWDISSCFKIIEDLEGYNIQLTNTALKQLGLETSMNVSAI